MLRIPYINIIYMMDEKALPEIKDIRQEINQALLDTTTKGFKSDKKMYRRIFNRSEREAKAIDKFGDPYFYRADDDVTRSISITLPTSMIAKVNEYCEKKKITRSRLIRKVLQYSLFDEIKTPDQGKI